MKTLIHAGTLFDGVSETLVQSPLVEIDDGVIIRVASGRLPSESAMLAIELGDTFLLPGLIDAHVHLCLNAQANAREDYFAASDEDILLRSADSARRHLEAGVTTVRDCGGRGRSSIDLARAIDSGKFTGARVIASAMPLCVPRGHCWFMGGEVDDEFHLIDTINGLVDAGAHFIKVMSTGGNFTPGTDVTKASFSLNELRTAAEVAHGRGVHIASHAHGAPGIANSVEAGIDTIEHCSWAAAGGPAIEPAILDRLVASQVAVVPTMGATYRQSLQGHVNESALKPLRAMVEIHRRMLAAGVKFIAGTDAGPGDRAHGSLPDELEALVGIGMTPLQALRAATSASAGALRVGHRLGSLRPGMAADVLALRADPTKDIGSVRPVELVIIGGRPVAGPALHRLPAAWL